MKSSNKKHLYKEAKPKVRAKKNLGQHFLKDEKIAEKIAASVNYSSADQILEIGPGMGVLTQFLLDYNKKVTAMDIDTESISYLNDFFSLDLTQAQNNLLNVQEADFLKADLAHYFGEQSLAIIGNFPYNISTQIVFKTLENRAQIPLFAGMFQKEVAQRICASPGSKTYGILSVLCKAFYTTEYLFTVHPESFNPPPKVQSGVMRMIRKANFQLECNEKLLFQVVKTAFGQRRKTLRNSLKSFQLSDQLKLDPIFAKRPEQLDVTEFISLTQKLEANAISDR
ncbi:MAG: 16S rRNA (adenine(1518)-N(6)/adenine(1519)-N(6))-dimethyltransferase RsmA [Flavobacteriaceae bacterium]|nr:16S rRNA (adenine(1518)-N(6)/adenine(1519)-N(6))-dimethyltransferase RsmA [Flavobacteriaceae bacterium]